MKQQSCHIRQLWHSVRPCGHFCNEIGLLWDTTKTPIMVEVELVCFLLSTMMGAYQTRLKHTPKQWNMFYGQIHPEIVDKSDKLWIIERSNDMRNSPRDRGIVRRMELPILAFQNLFLPSDIPESLIAQERVFPFV